MRERRYNTYVRSSERGLDTARTSAISMRMVGAREREREREREWSTTGRFCDDRAARLVADRSIRFSVAGTRAPPFYPGESRANSAHSIDWPWRRRRLVRAGQDRGRYLSRAAIYHRLPFVLVPNPTTLVPICKARFNSRQEYHLPYDSPRAFSERYYSNYYYLPDN